MAFFFIISRLLGFYTPSQAKKKGYITKKEVFKHKEVCLSRVPVFRVMLTQ